jgi:tRNA A37 threonylcarbamoyladenosine synthetase subunit TsaC/SUA5/YrdC
MLLDIIGKVGRPLLSTSVNISGKLNIIDTKSIDEEIANSVDFIMDGGICNNLSSTIIECKGDEIVVLRKGSIDIKK